MADSAKSSLGFWIAVGTALSLALGGAQLVSRAVAQSEVGPLDRRVTRLEAQREEDVKRLEEIKSDLKEVKALIEQHMRHPEEDRPLRR
jgi:hypothetical protein